MQKPVSGILIAGPTASGKSTLAMACARQCGGVVINADAMQIYNGLPILTSQPSQAMQTETPHRLYGFVDPKTRFSVGKWLATAHTVIEACIAANKMPIVVGGTGLYFRAMLHGLVEIPDIPQQIHDEVVALHKNLGGDAFKARLEKLDPLGAIKLHASDSLRLVRAYEVVIHTGQPMSAWQKQSKQDNSLAFIDWQRVLVLPPRAELYNACDQRFAVMIKDGAVGEVETLLAQELNPDLPAMKIIGVRELGDFLANKHDLNTAVQAAQQATRNYAKRQVTWFKNQWLTGQNSIKLIENILNDKSANSFAASSMVNL